MATQSEAERKSLITDARRLPVATADMLARRARVLDDTAGRWSEDEADRISAALTEMFELREDDFGWADEL